MMPVLALHALADRLDARRPHALMTEPLALAQALVIAEQFHGPTPVAEHAERELLAVLPPVADQTRGQYATRLRELADNATTPDESPR